MTAAKQVLSSNFHFSSSVEADAAHPQMNAKDYEWWYFDALSDDGKEAVVIIFLDNFIFSPRYNKERSKNSRTKDQKPISKVPAIAFVYYQNGKPVYRAVNEFGENDFSASAETPECRIGESGFTTEIASYGSGYLITVKANLSRRRKLEATFEWVSIESDFTPEKCDLSENSHCWNMVAPRSDVSGRISVFDKKDKEIDVRHFRGTGYHDHNLDHRWLPETVSEWHWGRVHYADATAVFYRYCEGENPETKLFLVRDGALSELKSDYSEGIFARDKFGIKYPKRLNFEADDGVSLLVEHRRIIDSSFFYLRFLSDITLKLPDGKLRRSHGITEFLAPEALKYRWLDWLVSMRIGRNGKGAFLA